MLLDTGMRLSEGAGLHVTDIHLEHVFPYVEVRPNKARRLKTSNSTRINPLVGESLWAANKNISDQKKLVRDNYSSDLRRFKTVSAMMKAIADRNAPIAECFFKGKAMGQQYAWLEANLVFEVARLLARMDVPTLTVHDKFTVPVDMVEAVHEVRYTAAF